MRIAEKTRNFHFQWERDSRRAYSYTYSPIHTFYGKPLNLYFMYSFIYSRNLNILEYIKPTTFFILPVTQQKKLLPTAMLFITITLFKLKFIFFSQEF